MVFLFIVIRFKVDNIINGIEKCKTEIKRELCINDEYHHLAIAKMYKLLMKFATEDSRRI